MAVQVDQVSGVGTLTKAGDFVDMVVGFTADRFPIVTVNPDDATITTVAGVNGTSVKALLQGVQVVGHAAPAAARRHRDPDPNAEPRRGPRRRSSTASSRSSSSRSPRSSRK